MTKRKTAKPTEATAAAATAETSETVTSTTTETTTTTTEAPTKGKKVKMIGRFTKDSVEASMKSSDKKNPISFKKWIEKNLPAMEAETPNRTIGEVRDAYEADMAAYHEQNKFSDKQLRKIEVAVRDLEEPRKHSFKVLERHLVLLHSLKAITGQPSLSWVGSHNVHIHVEYTADGMNALNKIFRPKRLRKHLSRVSSAITFSTLN